MKIIAAVAENGCIGKAGKIPWHFSEDFQHFKKVTLGHTIVMGRKTFESIGSRPLPGRKNVVLTSSSIVPCHNPQDVVTIGSFEDVLKLDGEIYICGGSGLYKEALPLSSELIITHIPGEYEGDTFFPAWPLSPSWQECSVVHGEDGLVYKTYEKRGENYE